MMDKLLLERLTMELTGGYPVHKPKPGNAALTIKANSRGLKYKDFVINDDGCFVLIPVPERFWTNIPYVGREAWVKTAGPFDKKGYVTPEIAGNVISSVQVDAVLDPATLPGNWHPEYDGIKTYEVDCSHLDLIPVELKELSWKNPGSTFPGYWAAGYEFRYHKIEIGFLPRKEAENSVKQYSEYTFGEGSYWSHHKWQSSQHNKQIEDFVANHPATKEAIHRYGAPANGFYF